MMLKHAGENAVLMSFAEDNAAAPPVPARRRRFAPQPRRLGRPCRET